LESQAQDSQFHDSLDTDQYVDYFEPFRKGQYRRVLNDLTLARSSTLLDVGASFGWMVEVGLELGLDAYGLEPSPLDYGPPVAGRVREATLEDFAGFGHATYDVVTIWHVLEHLRDPFVAAEQLRTLVAPSGVLVVAVPSTSGNLYRTASFAIRRLGQRRLMEELWYTHNENMHRYYFSPTALRLLLENAGLDVVSSYSLDAFDWARIWRRASTATRQAILRVAGYPADRLGVTRNENLIVCARRS
jgi:2-polyprenyl-3-methyl-5-hydroxy-6-metoxy-1,4-benzoquinol methylase